MRKRTKMQEWYLRLHDQYGDIRRKLYQELPNRERAELEAEARRINDIVGRLVRAYRYNRKPITNRIFQ